MLPPGSIIPFDGLNSNIPSKASRDDRFNGKFLKGALTSLGSTGGSNTHSHTADHSHTISAHSHTVTTGNPIDGATFDCGTNGGVVNKDHTHSGGSTGAASGGTSTDTMTLDSTSNLPPYYEVIFIKFNNYSLIPTNGMILRTSTRSNMTYHTASENKFLRGASSGSDAGNTGGATNHIHTQTHTHTPSSHSHATGNTGTHSSGWAEDGGNPESLAHGHSHTFTVQNSTQNMNSDSTSSDSKSHIPYNKSLLHYKASQNIMIAVGDIIMTTESTNPIGWIDCDGNNGTPNLNGFFIQNTQTAETISGSNTHNHTVEHSHTGNGTHTHTPNNPTGYSGDQGGKNGSGHDGRKSHRHNITSVSSVTANYSTESVVTNTVNNEPEYIKVKFIQATNVALGVGAGGSIIPSMMD